MNLEPTGRLVRIPGGRALVLTRTFRAPIDDVWASLTEPERTARWIGPWWGEGGVGKTVMFQMTAEEGAEPGPVTIRACDPPRALRLDLGVGDDNVWTVSVDLSEQDGLTTLEFRHELAEGQQAAEVGSGWEFYLDRLVASRNGDPLRGWEDYASQQSYYENLAIEEA